MLLNHVLLTYRVLEKMRDSVKFNEHGRTIRQFAGRKGGRRRVKKGFATNKKLASESGKKGMMNRWHGKDNNPRTDTKQEER